MAVHDGAETDALGDGAGALVDAGRGGKAQQGVGEKRELDVLEHGLAVQRTRMLEDDADPGPGDAMGRPSGDVDAVELHRAGIRPLDAHDELHHRRFAGAVRADEAEDLAARDVEGDVLDGDEAAEALGEAADGEARGAGHSRSPARSA